MQKRFQTTLTLDLYDRLRELAHDTRLSIAEHIRRAVVAYLAEIADDNQRGAK